MRLRRVVLWMAVAGVLALVFMAYFQPTLMVQVSEQIWACF